MYEMMEYLMVVIIYLCANDNVVGHINRLFR